MDHKASYIMTRATVVAEVTHRGQVGVSHINMSSHGGYGWWVPTRRFLSEDWRAGGGGSGHCSFKPADHSLVKTVCGRAGCLKGIL